VQAIEKWQLLAMLQLSLAAFSQNRIFAKSREFPDRDGFAADCVASQGVGRPENLCSSRAFLSVESRCVAVEDEGLH
jgi:hypothetical protein